MWLKGLSGLNTEATIQLGWLPLMMGEILLRRKKVSLENYLKCFPRNPIEGELAIGHTRWATHGRPSDENAHPHVAGDLVLVHNGIIENYLELREELEQAGIEFQSETDSEVLAQLIARESAESVFDQVLQGLKHVRGAYAIAVISAREPDAIVVAKNASPLVLGTLEDASILASDIPALLPFTRDVIILEEETAQSSKRTLSRFVVSIRVRRLSVPLNELNGRRSWRRRVGTSTSCTKRCMSSLVRFPIPCVVA